MNIIDLLGKIGAIKSMAQGRRAVEMGAVEVDGTPITDPQQEVDGTVVKFGKRMFTFPDNDKTGTP
jgi:tyrosyl-tRNA synthetase